MTMVEAGSVNAHVIGIVMKEAVRRAIMVIRAQRFIFEAQAKAGYSGDLDDMVTSADHRAQQVYVKMLTECFPLCGILAEEEDLRLPCRIPGRTVLFTVDPLDGTRAYVRKQSHGIGTMLSLVSDGEVIAAYVGDVMTQEIYGFRPESDRTHRISEFDHVEDLRICEERKLSEQYVLLRKAPDEHGETIRRLIQSKAGFFRDLEVTAGSIGASMARLWKGEVGAAVLNPGYETPWDMCPIVGISQHLGFVFLKATCDGKLERFKPEFSTHPQENKSDVLIVHKSRIHELSALLHLAHK
jgi:fructose-1,6-bisphosphatase/inositol monophosphatase family enzyme